MGRGRQWTRNYSPVVEVLPSMGKALDSAPYYRGREVIQAPAHRRLKQRVESSIIYQDPVSKKKERKNGRKKAE